MGYSPWGHKESDRTEQLTEPWGGGLPGDSEDGACWLWPGGPDRVLQIQPGSVPPASRGGGMRDGGVGTCRPRRVLGRRIVCVPV